VSQNTTCDAPSLAELPKLVSPTTKRICVRTKVAQAEFPFEPGLSALKHRLLLQEDNHSPKSVSGVAGGLSGLRWPGPPARSG